MRFKYAVQCYIENNPEGDPKKLDSCRVGDLFTCEATAIRAAKNTLGYKSGRFPNIHTFRVRVSMRLWQSLNEKEIAA